MDEGKHTTTGADQLQEQVRGRLAPFLNRKWTDAPTPPLPLARSSAWPEASPPCPKGFKLHPLVEKVADRAAMGRGSQLDWGMGGNTGLRDAGGQRLRCACRAGLRRAAYAPARGA
jgi:2-oxoglutarate dehydrogenase E1 component